MERSWALWLNYQQLKGGNEMKGLYRADAVNRTFVSSDVVADDYQLKDNETF